MKQVKSLLISGLIGTGIGAIWFSIVALWEADWNIAKAPDLSLNTFIFWILIAFIIGVVFNICGRIFNLVRWSFRKQLIVNFFVLFAAWIIFGMVLTGFNCSLSGWIYLITSFIVMYLIGYGSYFLHLKEQINIINRQLKK